MTTAVAVANLALSHLGDDATIVNLDPPEGSAQAEQAALFYPIARDALLEMYPWNFALRRTTLALLDEDPNTQWRYAYALPSNVLAVFAGKLDYPSYGFFDRFMIRLIMRMTHGPTDPKAVIEFTDWQQVEAFGRGVSEMA